MTGVTMRKAGTGRSAREIFDRRGRRVQIDYPVRIFEAMISLECAGCGTTIDPGALFTRKTFREGAEEEESVVRTLPVCNGCQPFTPVAWADAMLA